jgi:phosphoserine phosphatase
LDFIKNIDREHTESYIVSASLDIWVKPFADKLNMILLATKAEFIDDIFTGNLGKNCNKDEKVCRIEAELGIKIR